MHSFFRMFLALGPLGPFLLGIADSSFLFLPFGNDLLLVILIARKAGPVWAYVLIAALGSMAGVFLLDLVARNGGEAGLQKMMSPKRLAYLEKKMNERAGYAVALACIAPPPFPFTAVIAAAAAFQYPRRKLLSVVGAARIVRFSILAALALMVGREIIAVTQSPEFYWSMIAFTAFCAVGSVYSVAGWIRRSRQR